MKINARPHINGNSEADFEQVAQKVDDLKIRMQAVCGMLSATITHGRNYQHLPTDQAIEVRNEDLEEVAVFRGFVAKLDDLFNAIIDAKTSD